MKTIAPHELDKIIEAILLIQAKIRWKPGKAEPHLAKRIRLGHIPENSTLKNYETIIRQIITNQEAQVYVYIYEQFMYPTLTVAIENRLWLVMIDMDGILETAFPPSNPQKYLDNNNFV